MGVASAITAMSLVVVSAESKLLDPIKSWYSKFSLPIEIQNTGLANSVDESLYLAKAKVESVVSNPGAGSGTPYLDTYTSASELIGTEFVITLSVIAGIGVVLSFVFFNNAIQKFQKDRQHNIDPSSC